MSAVQEPILGLFYGWSVSEDWGSQMDQNLRLLAAACQLTALNDTLTAPPASPAVGDRYIVPASPTGDWAGHATHIAMKEIGGWTFLVPRDGWRCDVTNPTRRIVRYNASLADWEVIPGSGPGLGDITGAANLGGGLGLYINKTADTLNFKTLAADGDISFSTLDDLVTLKVRGISALTKPADGVGVYHLLGDVTGEVGAQTRQVKSIKAGDNVTLDEVDGVITISSSGGGGGVVDVGQVVNAILTDGSNILLGADGTVLYGV